VRVRVPRVPLWNLLIRERRRAKPQAANFGVAQPVEQAAVNRKVVGSTPTPGADTERQANRRWGPFRKRSSSNALRVRLPLFPLNECKCPWPSGKGDNLPNCLRWVRFPQGTLGDRLTVGCLALNQAMKVRALLPEFVANVFIPGSANGRPSGSEPENGGPIPSPGTRWMARIRQLGERLSLNLSACGFDSHSGHKVQRPGTQTGKASKLKPCCGVGSTPTRATCSPFVSRQWSVANTGFCH
jgi:hypothetical protein